MKKTLMIIAIVLCVAVAGAALAVTKNNATTVTGTLQADSYFGLDFGNNTVSADISLAYGAPQNFVIECDVTKSRSVDSTATLTITLADGVNTNLDEVNVKVYSDSARQNLVANGSLTGAGTITITGITIPNENNDRIVSDTVIYYATASLVTDVDADDIDEVGGTMTLHLVKA